MTEPFTFTLDLEDHRPSDGAELRLPAVTRQVLAHLAEREVVGTVFVVGEVARDHPDLVKEVVDHGHEVGLHAWRHVPLTELDPATFRVETARGRELLRELTGQDIVGYRAPTFSLVRTTTWATEVLSELGFTYSSSVLPARSPLFGFPGAPRRPFTWPSGLVEIPAPLIRLGPLGLPFIGGTYLRLLPLAVVRAAQRFYGVGPVPLTYCHPYDFDTGERFWVVPGTGRLGSVLLWIGRRRMYDKIDALIGDRPGPPLRERLHHADPPDAHVIPSP